MLNKTRIPTMTLAPRQHDILALARERGYVSIDELAQAFAVTPQTIRRDINQLAEQGLLRRTHGGAASEASSTQNTAYTMRAGQMREEKQRIAAAIAAHIPDHASLFINIGTTTEAIARELLKRKGLKVITNNLQVAAQLSAKADFEVLVTGGTVRSDGGIVGQSTVDFIQQFKVDFALVGISGIDEDGSLLDFDYQEVRVSQAIIDNARQVFLAVDSSKFGRNAVVRLGSITLVDRVFTDAAPSPTIKRLLAENKVQLDVV
jgi:DeoR family glycerol-3-phosphate regulon repressor